MIPLEAQLDFIRKAMLPTPSVRTANLFRRSRITPPRSTFSASSASSKAGTKRHWN